jgi:ankyrin repeat protein
MLSSLLDLAASKGLVDVVDILLACEMIDVNGTGSHGYSALRRAAISGSVGVVENLLRHPGIDINENTHRATALHLASRHNQVAVIELLLRHHDIAVHCKDAVGDTALRTAVSYGASAAVQLLLAQPDHNAGDQDPDSTTLLQLASQRGQLDMVLLLMKHEAISLEDPRNSKSSLLREAVWNLRWPVVEFLVNHAGKLSKSACITIHISTEHNTLETLGLLLNSEDFSVAEADRAGQTLLHKASRKGALHILTRIVALAYVNVNYLDDKGWSALHCAAFAGQLGAVELLLKHASININASKQHRYGQEGITALTLAKRKGFTDIIDLLMSHGASDVDNSIQYNHSVRDDEPSREQDEVGEACERPADLESEWSEDWQLEGRTDATAIVIQDSADETDSVTHEPYESASDDESRIYTAVSERPIQTVSRWKAESHEAYPRRRPDPARSINKFGKPMMY